MKTKKVLRKMYPLRMPSDLMIAVKKLAKEEHRSINSYIQILLTRQVFTKKLIKERGVKE